MNAILKKDGVERAVEISEAHQYLFFPEYVRERGDVGRIVYTLQKVENDVAIYDAGPVEFWNDTERCWE